MKKFKVYLLAFSRIADPNEPVQSTEVNVPLERYELAKTVETGLLDLIYEFGQNDFRTYDNTQTRVRSVSMGDVIELETGDKYLVGDYGFITDTDPIERITKSHDWDTKDKFEYSNPFIVENFPKLHNKFQSEKVSQA